jgi:hypothetical protein
MAIPLSVVVPLKYKETKMSKIIAVCTSTKKGIKKNPVEEVIIEEDYGIDGDAHADC